MERLIPTSTPNLTDRKIRIRSLLRLRWLLRWLPSKRKLCRCPVLGKFGSFLREQKYLWCFQEDRVGPAILVGSIIAFLPIFGVQLITVVALAIILKVNLPVLAGLQFISNPLTLAPIYLANYKVGSWLLATIGLSSENTNAVFSSINSTMLGGIVLGTLFGLLMFGAYRIRLKLEKSTSTVAL
ncbi:MAG: DUF2062 domain-containing protein [Verrucomicrobiae bacterium]|nr:DUF2062 domain-containing protein [Verrucomicrobiae bacterium]